jgi:hypothetical protein
MPRMGFDPTIPVLELVKTVYVLDRATTLMAHMTVDPENETDSFDNLRFLPSIVTIYNYYFIPFDSKTPLKLIQHYKSLTALEPRDRNLRSPCQQFDITLVKFSRKDNTRMSLTRHCIISYLSND